MPATIDRTDEITALYADALVKRTTGGTPYRSLPPDDFVEYLTFANAGMLNRGNLLCMDYAMGHLPNATAAVVEVGSFCGLSTNLLAHFGRKHGASNPVFNCDPWDAAEAPGGVGGPGIGYAEYRRFVRASYERNLRLFSRDRLPHSVQQFSDDFFADWAAARRVTDLFGRPATLGGPIAFAHVDGDHGYDQSRRDFLHVDRFLAPGGLILFDDSADGSKWDVTRMIADEVKRRPNYEVVIRNPNYLVRKTAA